MRYFGPLLLRVAMLVVVLMAVPVNAQVDNDRPAAAVADQPIEELVVVAKKPGDQVDAQAKYEAQLRKILLDEADRLRVLEEEYQWRRSSDSMTVESPGRMRWGYDPEDDLEMRRHMDIMDLPAETSKPATLFKARF